MSESIIKTPEFKDGHHPNSVRHLKPQTGWNIYIDETGNDFNDKRKYADESVQDGKFVALVVPYGKSLNKNLIPEQFHAAKEAKNNNNTLLDEIINEVLSENVGVLGMAHKDAINSQISWFHGICQFIQLIIRLLPLQPSDNNKIHFYIENRKDFNGDHGYFDRKFNTDALNLYFTEQFQAIHQGKFDNLSIKTQFCSKNFRSQDYHIFNAYVDTIAHSWGGGAAAQKRRQKAKFSGHCFLNIQDLNAAERLYMMIDNPKKKLAARDWYELMAIMADEPKHSLLYDYMSNIGKITHKDGKLWQSYLDEVQTRLKYKDYKVNQLTTILSWLDDHRPSGVRLPQMVELQFLSAKLASVNHEGKVNIVKMSDVLEMGNCLIEEDAQSVAHAYLRLATSYANAFDFEHMYAILNQDIMKNKLAIGLSNYAKTLSSLGQYYCFINDPKKSIDYFKQAIASFEKLSNQSQAKKDISQTKTYLAYAYIQSNEPFRKQMQELFNVKSLLDSVEIYAKNSKDSALGLDSSDNGYKFRHQLILRMLNQGHYDDLKSGYLKYSDQWAVGKGHPWQSIYFWRGVLLAETGRKEQAQKQFNQLLNDVNVLELEDLTLIWIYVVLSVAIDRLGFETNAQIMEIGYPIVKQYLEIERYDKLHELKQATDLEDIRRLVLECLPFNYA